MSTTNKYVGRRNLIVEQTDQIRQQKRRMQSQMLDKKKTERTDSLAKKSVPTFIQSSKTIANEKKKQTQLTEMMDKSKEGGAGKGGRGGK